MKSIILTILLTIILLAGCTPDLFQLNRMEQYRIYGKIIGDLDGVDVLADNALRIYPGGKASMRSIGLTQMIADLTVEIESGEGVIFYLRNAENRFNSRKSLQFKYTVEGSLLSETMGSAELIDTIKAELGNPSRVLLESDGKLTRVKVDCRMIYLTGTEIPATEYLIVESIGNSTVKLTGINFGYILETEALTNSVESVSTAPVLLNRTK